MKAVTLDSIVGVIRARRGYKTFLSEFINECDIVDAIEIPEGATNGDMIKAMFPNAKFDNAMPFTDNRWETVDLDTENKIRGTYSPTQLRVYADWWNAPYKRGNKNEIID
jgi:hypothetical protein